MDNNEKSNITIGLPKANGAVFWAPLGTTLPTNASDALNAGFVNLGYISEDGVTMSTEESVDKIRAWGREVVMVSSTEYSETFSLNFLETVRESVLQFMKGTDNVNLSGDGSLRVKTTGDVLPRGSIVIDTIQNNGSATPRTHRIVFGDCQISDRSGDQTYNNSDPLVYPATIEAFKFESPVDQTLVYKEEYWTAPGSVSA